MIDGVAKLWPIAVALLLLIGSYFTTSNRIDNLQTAVAGLQGIPKEVAQLEDERVSDNASVSLQISSLEGQIQGLQSSENDLGKGVSGIQQQLATLQAQITFLIGQNWPTKAPVR